MLYLSSNLDPSELERRAYIENWPNYELFFKTPMKLARNYLLYKAEAGILRKRLDQAVKDAVQASLVLEEIYTDQELAQAEKDSHRSLHDSFPDEDHRTLSDSEINKIIRDEEDPAFEIPKLFSEIKKEKGSPPSVRINVDEKAEIAEQIREKDLPKLIQMEPPVVPKLEVLSTDGDPKMSPLSPPLSLTHLFPAPIRIQQQPLIINSIS